MLITINEKDLIINVCFIKFIINNKLSYCCWEKLKNNTLIVIRLTKMSNLCSTHGCGKRMMTEHEGINYCPGCNADIRECINCNNKIGDPFNYNRHCGECGKIGYEIYRKAYELMLDNVGPDNFDDDVYLRYIDLLCEEKNFVK